MIKFRRQIYELAIAKAWTHRTTLAKIRSNILDDDSSVFEIIFKKY